MAHSPHKHRKGHCGADKQWKNRGNGDTERMPFAARRKLGIRRRFNRHDV